MAVRKATSRKRATTAKRATSARATTKKVAKRKTAAAKAAEPAMAEPEVVAPEIFAPEAAAPVRMAPQIVPPKRPTPIAARQPARYERPLGDQPSKYTADHYLHATGPQREDGAPRRPGKWLIFVSRSRVDALWNTIKRAVESGRLGYAAKVSTALPNPMSPDPKKHIICVYTPNEDDAADVRRVRDVLRGLGVTWKIPYKSDAATKAGQHEVTAGGPAAKYYE
jgi:hypothetical protein